jgi:hypothetical protein
VPTVEGRRRLTRPDAERFARKHALPIVRLAIDRAIAWGRDPLAVVIATLTRPERVGALEAELQDRARDREREAAILQAGRDAAERMEREFQEEVEAFLQDPRVRADPLVARALANASKARAEKSECGFWLEPAADVLCVRIEEARRCGTDDRGGRHDGQGAS